MSNEHRSKPARKRRPRGDGGGERDRLPPAVRRLVGILPKKASLAQHRRHLRRKHGL